jgi:hypothetical protein
VCSIILIIPFEVNNWLLSIMNAVVVFHIVLNVQVSDTTDVDSSNEAKYISVFALNKSFGKSMYHYR